MFVMYSLKSFLRWNPFDVAENQYTYGFEHTLTIRQFSLGDFVKTNEINIVEARYLHNFEGFILILNLKAD